MRVAPRGASSPQQPPTPPLAVVMGNCVSAAAPAGAAVHAAEALPPRGSPADKGTAKAAGAAAAGKKRGAVGQADTSAAEADTVDNMPRHEKSAADTAAVLAAIKDNILFRDLQEPELQALLVAAMSPLSVAAGTAVVTQGDRAGDTFYVIRSGACTVTVDGAQVARLEAGRAFGELALLYSCPRAATVAAAEATQLWVLHQRWYRLVARSAAQLRVRQKCALLRKVEMFAKLTPSQLAVVAESLVPLSFEGGDVIITKGETGDCFYMVRAGEAVVSDGGRELARIGAGGSFGERALLRDEVRAAHITAAPGATVQCFALHREAFNAALAMADETFRVGALQSMAQLAPLSMPQMQQLAAAAEAEQLAPGGEAMLRGKPMDGIYILEDGTLEASDPLPEWKHGASVSRGFATGAASLLAAGAAACVTLRAGPGGASLLRVRRADFVAALGTLEEVTAAARLASLRRVPLLAPLPPDALLPLARELEALTFPDGAAVVRQGDPGDAFYLLERGLAAVTDASGTEYARLRDGAYFGELALMADDGADGVRKASVVARGGPLHVLRMTRASFAALRSAHPAVAAALAAGQAGYAPVAYTARIGLKDLQLRRALGVGTFGKVFLATHRGKRYALKQVHKGHLVAKGLVAHIKRERDVMAECGACPFLVNLAASFQDGGSLYLLMELVMGGELFYYLQSLRAPLHETHARFYTACVVEAFDFLHSRHYLYRDLKPENLLLTADGYLKVADFSFAKRLRAGKTYTLCGTPAYLAPEQITRAGHDRAVDWWALGVLTYEMLAGGSPFYHDDDMTMFKRIVDVKYSFVAPVPKMTYEAKDLINGLLQKAPHQRLPMGRRGVGAVREHAWFKGFNWDALGEGRLKAPHVPKLRDADDMRFFADCEDEQPGAEYSAYTSVGNFSDF